MKQQPTRKSAANKPVRKRSAFRKLAKKQTAFVKGKVVGMSDAAAARTAGYAESIARKPSKITESPNLQKAFLELLEMAHVTAELLAGPNSRRTRCNESPAGHEIQQT